MNRLPSSFYYLIDVSQLTHEILSYLEEDKIEYLKEEKFKEKMTEVLAITKFADHKDRLLAKEFFKLGYLCSFIEIGDK